MQARVSQLHPDCTDYDPTALNSVQTSTGTRISLNKNAIFMEHQTGPESTLRYAMLRTLFVVNVARRGTLFHYVEAVGHPSTC